MPLALIPKPDKREIARDSVKMSEAIVAGDFNLWNATSTSTHKDSQALARMQPGVAPDDQRQSNPRAVSSIASFRLPPAGWEHWGINE
jgi:hypothetical protein